MSESETTRTEVWRVEHYGVLIFVASLSVKEIDWRLFLRVNPRDRSRVKEKPGLFRVDQRWPQSMGSRAGVYRKVWTQTGAGNNTILKKDVPGIKAAQDSVADLVKSIAVFYQDFTKGALFVEMLCAKHRLVQAEDDLKYEILRVTQENVDDRITDVTLRAEQASKAYEEWDALWGAYKRAPYTKDED